VREPENGMRSNESSRPVRFRFGRLISVMTTSGGLARLFEELNLVQVRPVHEQGEVERDHEESGDWSWSVDFQ